MPGFSFRFKYVTLSMLRPGLKRLKKDKFDSMSEQQQLLR